MAESFYHMELVNMIESYVYSNFINITNSFVMVDKPQSQNKPVRTIDGYCPDLYYCFNRKLIIGEAKTINDFERNHSIKQYESYIKEASNFAGEASIIFAVPWSVAYTLRSILKNMKKDIDINVLIITDIGRVITI